MEESNLFERFIRQKSNSDDQDKKAKKERRSTQEIEKAFEKAARMSSDIKDIRDELNILRTVAKYQETIQRKWSDGDSRLIDQPATYIIKDITEMDNIADRIQTAVSKTCYVV